MKTLKLFVLLSALISISYLLSCDMNKNSVVESPAIKDGRSTTGNQNEIDAPPDKCPIPSSCNNGNGEHLCLYLTNGTTNEEFVYGNIRKIRVTHTGTDCVGNSYYCNYILNGGNATTMGCVLPWYTNYCQYTRTVCLETYDNETYTGSRTFGYQNFSGCTVTVYLTDNSCDFGGIERNNDL
ncbi:MAG: hypothetical protein NTY74_02515 [Ignavibacteriae bacterium]|nr:hypothetical protein [Ignavibacteriota bacterium]